MREAHVRREEVHVKGRIIKLNFGLMTSQNTDEVHAGKLPCGP